MQPPIATTSNNGPCRKLSETESKELEKVYNGLTRQIRIFLGDTLSNIDFQNTFKHKKIDKLMKDRRFNIFNEPVDGEEYDDYYEVIKEPMCMGQMMEKIDRSVLNSLTTKGLFMKLHKETYGN